MKEHINYVENKKRKEYQKHNELLVLSPRFISFFQYVFNCGEGDKMAFNQFANVILKRTNGLGFYDKDYQILFQKLNADENIQIQFSSFNSFLIRSIIFISLFVYIRFPDEFFAGFSCLNSVSQYLSTYCSRSQILLTSLIE